MVPGDPADADTQLGALVSEEHLAGVLGRVERAAGDGARLLVGGGRAEPVPGGAYMQPTVLEALDPADPIVQEEVFGPVLAIQEADDAEHAIALANGTGYGLAAAVWSSNITTAHRVARRLRAGTVWINTFDVSSLTHSVRWRQGLGPRARPLAPRARRLHAPEDDLGGAVMRVGFIGLGNMGGPMCGASRRGRVRRDGVRREPGRAGGGWSMQGARAASSVADCARGAEALITMLPAPPHVEEVLLGERRGDRRSSSPARSRST